MQFKRFFLLLAVLYSGLLSANNTPATPETSTFTVPALTECDLPAPANFKVEAIGANWVTFSWGTAGVVANRIRLYRSSDNALLSTTIVPAGTWSATIAIPFNTPVYAVINSICSDGTNSENTTPSGTITGVILELVVNGYNGNFNSSNCIIPNVSECDISPVETTQFRVNYNGQSKKFGVQVVKQATQTQYRVHTTSPNTGNNNTFSFYCNPNGVPSGFPVPSCISNAVRVTYWQNGIETTIAVLDAYVSATNIHKLKPDVYGSTTIEKLVPAFRPSIDERGEEGPAPIAAVAPNPFQDGFDVFMDASAQQVSLQLFNLSGQKVFDQQFTGGQEQYSVPAVGLAAGFYLLRVEVDGAVQTLKVVKSE